ncbi:hypothetical protein E8E12_011536 [Didymella heteroderae]|uniref:Uncharacterized protein n=1 Tax=Didymella heteroderae TaxID=1769908 RepID=A0A9P5C4X2_9PLEO|nr:hypothetical protein E8E12_011536 [Didymella heteroderae]
MTLLVARRCRLWAAAGTLRRLPAAVTTRSYADDADAAPELPRFIRKLVANAPRGPPATRINLSHPRQDGSRAAIARNSARGDARSGYAKKQQSASDDVRVTPELQDCEIGSVHSAILVPVSVAATTPEHFVDKIESLRADAIPGNDLAVFLATPSFATWLLDDSVFLEKALAKLYRDRRGSAQVHAVCAVVDRLPQPTHIRGRDGGNPIQAALKERAIHPPVNETGVEGIAYVTLPHKATLSAQPTVSGEHGCIDFLAHTKTTKRGRYHDRVRVPLANTVFQTGAPSTLISSSWSPSSSGRLERKSREPLKTLAIDLSAQRLALASQTTSPRHHDVPTLSIPLVPLTFPRQVDGHMGNIIRGLIDADGNKMTASTELEQVVPRYFETRGESPRATSAWAVVIEKRASRLLINQDSQELLATSDTALGPSDQQGLERFWREDPPRWNQRVQHSFFQGARLHKVLSGGGGWGKKAGLLSLDPMPIGPPQAEPAAKMDGDYETVDEFSTALKPVVKDGDYIQFFISPAVSQDQDVGVQYSLDQASPSDTSEKQPWSWEFGVIPSTIDSIPGDSPQTLSEASGEITVHKGTFGALTEGGLTLMRGSGMDEKTGIAEKEFNTTTIDVPFARWSAMRLVPKEGVQLQTIRELRGQGAMSFRKNVSVRDFSTSTLATFARPTAVLLTRGIQTPHLTRAFSTIRTLGAERAPTSHKRRKQRAPDSVTPSTEQGGLRQNKSMQDKPTQDKPMPSIPQSPLEAEVAASLKTTLANLNIPVWKRATIRRVRHHFDDTQRGGQKDPDFLVRKIKTSTGSLQPQPKQVSARGGENEHSNNDWRSVAMTSKRPKWTLGSSPSTRRQSERNFSTTPTLDWKSHERRRKKRQLKRAEQDNPLVLRSPSASARPLVRRCLQNEEPGLDAHRAQQASVTPREKPTPRIRKLSNINSTSTASQKPRNTLPRLLRQVRGEVPPRGLHERANGEADRDFAKLEGFLWREYYRVVSSVRKVSKELPKKSKAKPASRKGKTKQDGTVRMIRIATPSESPGKLAEQCFASINLTDRHLAMLTQQLRAITGREASRSQARTASKHRKDPGPRSSGRKRRLVRTIRLPSPSSEKAQPNRARITLPRRTKAPHRNPAGLAFTMRSLPLDPSTPPTSILTTPKKPLTPSSTPSPPPPDIVPFRPLLHHRPALLRSHILPALHHQATRMIKRAQLLAAQTRALLPTAPVPISSHSTLTAVRSRASRRPTTSRSTVATRPREPQGEKKTHRRCREPRARRVLLGGWRRISKHLSGRTAPPSIRKYAQGAVSITKIKDKSRRQELADDVGAWLKGDGAYK